VPLRRIATLTGLSLGSLYRHKAHIRDALSQAMDARAEESARHNGDLLRRIEKVIEDAEGILLEARAAKSFGPATQALNSITRALELIARISGDLQPNTGVGVHVSLNKVTNSTINNFDSDAELASLIAEATRNFDATEIRRLKAISENTMLSVIVKP